MADDEPESKSGPDFVNLPHAFQYSASLNCLISLSKGSGLEIYDVHSRRITSSVPLVADNQGDNEVDHCKYLENEEKLIITSGAKIGCRSSSGEQIFLQTILNPNNFSDSEEVTIELDIAKAGLLLTGLEKCLNSPQLMLKNEFQQVIALLKINYEKVIAKMKILSSQEIKWLSVCFSMEHEVLKKVFNMALLICKQENRGPALPVIGDVLQRLTSTCRKSYENVSSEKRLMFNEVDRLQTFNSWPHMNYKWALPGPMAEAGFYHPHSSKSVEDRAMCFTCSVCLVSWESSDQPWSEHKRHSKDCPFVMGEYTENVPLSVYHSTASAQVLQRPNDKVVCVSSCCNNLIATGTAEGYIVLWTIFPMLKIHSEYQISVCALKEGSKKKLSNKRKSTVLSKTKDEGNDPDIKSQSTIASKSVEKKDFNSNNNSAKDKVDSGSQVQNEVQDFVYEGESYCLITDSKNNSEFETPDDEEPYVFTVEDTASKSEDENTTPTNETKGTFERKCKIASVTIMSDENERNTYVVAGVKIKSKKTRKSKVKIKKKLSLLVYKVAGKIKVADKTAEIPNLFPYPFDMELYDDMMPLPEPSSVYDPPIFDEPYLDPNQLSVIDEYLNAAKKNPTANGGTQNISLFNEVKAGFDQEEIVKVDDIKTVYEDCTFHKFDIDRSFYDASMIISDLIVISNYLVVILKQKASAIEEGNIKNVLLVFTIFSNNKQVTEIKLVNSQTVYGTTIKDAIQVSYSNAPSNVLEELITLEQFEGSDRISESNSVEALLLIALEDSSLSFMTVPKLVEKKIPLSLDGAGIHKIVYCGPLSSVAICDTKGYLHIHSCLEFNEPKAAFRSVEMYDGQWPMKFSQKELEWLEKITKFEMVTQGCYLFSPMTWSFSRGKLINCSLKPSPKNMFHLIPAETDNRFMKRTNLEDNKHDLTFNMYIMVKTFVGYFDVVVNLKSPLQVGQDFQFSVCMANDVEGRNASDSTNSRKIIYGPVLFSSMMDEKKLSASFTIVNTSLLIEKSFSFFIKLHCKQHNISELLKDLYVGVHQFKNVAEQLSLFFPGCQHALAVEKSIQSSLVDQLLTLVKDNGEMKEGAPIKTIVSLLLWIVSMNASTLEKEEIPLVQIILDVLPSFIHALLFYGDRSLCHSCCLLLTSLKRQTSNQTFRTATLEVLWNLIPNIQSARSAAATHWIFVTLLDFLEDESFDALPSLIHMLLDSAKKYAVGFTELQKVFDTKFGCSEMVFEPSLVEPLFIRLKSGNKVKLSGSQSLELIEIPSSHLPGVLEVMPLKFSCLSVSEGSKFDQLKSSTIKSAHKKETNQDPNIFNQQSTQPAMLSSLAAAAKGYLADKEQMDPFDFLNYMPPGYSNGEAKASIPKDVEENTKEISSKSVVGFPDENVIPYPSCLLVDKMHVYSVHYAILDFQTPVYLTDIILPPCKALSSITLTSWCTDQLHPDGTFIASSEEINKSALVISNLVQPLKLQFLKITVVGGDSCSAIIQLGQYFGYPVQESADSLEMVQRQYNDLFCRFSLTADRLVKPLVNRLQVSSKSKMQVNIVKENTKKDIELCSYFQMCLNILSNHFNSRVGNLLEMKDLEHVLPVKESNFSSQQLLLSCILKALSQYISSLQLKNVSIQKDLLTKSQFLDLFSDLCIYGDGDIQETATRALFHLCSKTGWWEDGLIEIYQQYFRYSSVVPIPKKRVFFTLMKMMKHSSGLSFIIEKLLHQLNVQVESSALQLDPSSLDWLLLALDHLLDYSDENPLWSFFDPFKADEQPKKETLPKLDDIFPDPSLPPMAEAQTSEQVKQEQIINDSHVTSKQITGKVFLKKSACISSAQAILKYLTLKLGVGNRDQMILCCKVISLVIIRCQSLVQVEEVLTQTSFSTLLNYNLTSTDKWISYAINLLLKTIVVQKDEVFKELCGDTKSDQEKTSLSTDIHMSDQASKMDKLKMLKEKAMHKHFFEATEGNKYAGALATDKFQDLVTSDKEQDLTTDSVQCPILHPTNNSFLKILDSNIFHLQKKLWGGYQSNELDKKSQQKLWIPCYKTFGVEISTTKTQAVSFYLRNLGMLIDQGVCGVTSASLELVLFFVVMSSQVSLPQPVVLTFCQSVIKLMSNMGESFSAAARCLMNCIVDKIMCERAFTSFFSTQLLELLQKMENPQKQHHTGFGDRLADISMMSIMRLASNENMTDDERILLRRLMLRVDLKNTDVSKALETFKMITKNGCFSKWTSEEEKSTSMELVTKTCCFIEDFIRESASLLHAASFERGDTKRTVFLLQDGECRLTGKAHVVLEDVQLCIVLVNMVHQILSTKIVLDFPDMEMILEKLMKICMYGAKLGGLQKTFEIHCQPLHIKEQMFYFQARCDYHPLASCIMYTVFEAGKDGYSTMLANSLINLVVVTWKGQDGLQFNSLVHIVELLLTRNQEIWEVFKSRGGFDKLIQIVNENPTANINCLDALPSSPVLQSLYGNVKTSCGQSKSSSSDKEKPHKDQDGETLENFSSIAKITGPPSSPGPEVLLGNKSPLRRSRFPAWGHHFQDGDDCWISLIISFPFEVMLKEVVIHMHGNYLIGTPSALIAEIKNLSEFVTVSPHLDTGGLQSIVLHFGETVICKELKLRLCRPNGGDNIKLNLIELFGKPIFLQEIPFPSNSIFFFDYTTRRAFKPFAIEPFMRLILEKGVLHAYHSHRDFEQFLINCIMAVPYLSKNCMYMLGEAFTSTHQFSVPISTMVTNTITSNLLSAQRIALLHSTQITSLVKLIYNVVFKASQEDQQEVFANLLVWFYDFLHKVNLDDASISHTVQLVINKLFKSFKNMNSTGHEKPLIQKVQDLLTTNSIYQDIFQSLGHLLNLLVTLVSRDLANPFSKAHAWVDSLCEQERGKSNDCLIALFYCTEDTKDECLKLLDKLSIKFLKLLSIKNSTESENVEKLLQILEVLKGVFATDCPLLYAWFVTVPGQSLIQPLIAWLVRYGVTSSVANSLSMFRALQSGVGLLQKMLYLNPVLQEKFCRVLYDTLLEFKSRCMSGYLKYIINQLVVVDETVNFTFKLKEVNDDIIVSTHQIQLRLTSTISDLIKTIKKFRTSLFSPVPVQIVSEEKSSKHTSPSFVSSSSSTKSSYASNPLLFTGNMAIAKRRSQQTSESKVKQIIPRAPTSYDSIAVDFFAKGISDNVLPADLKVSQILQALQEKGELSQTPTLLYNIFNPSYHKSTVFKEEIDWSQQKPMLSVFERFAEIGGLTLLLPNYQDNNSNQVGLLLKIISLPGYSQVFLRDVVKAQLLLRSVMGVKETKLGQQISSLSVAKELPTLPLTSFRDFLQQSSYLTTQGFQLRKMAFHRDAIKHILQNLNSLYFHNESKQIRTPSSTSNADKGASSSTALFNAGVGNKDSTYWAKGTGFGFGSTVSSWDIEKAMKQKKQEEKDMVIILQVLTAFLQKHSTPVSIQQQDEDRSREKEEEVSPQVIDQLMSAFAEHMVVTSTPDILSSYLHNDSVLDMSRHIPLYRAVLSFLRPLAENPPTLCLLTKKKNEGPSIVSLLAKLKSCVDTYNSRLSLTTKFEALTKADTKKTSGSGPLKSRLKICSHGSTGRNDATPASSSEGQSELESEELNELMKEINDTTTFILHKAEEHEANEQSSSSSTQTLSVESADEESLHDCNSERFYVERMSDLQFDAFELITEKDDGTLQFNVPYHYASVVRDVRRKDTDVFNINRARRLAQEVASLSTSLPLSYSSTVFLRCDEQRLDIMKVLITGPEGTPYENGCFEFDIYIPPEYPASPMSVNLQTTGKHTVRFNPNLYNDGKVCLSILNTWHGRPEEKWNEKTSNLLQVLVSIQSLILVAEPYFNEPGYERLKGKPQGEQNSNDYNTNIRQACVKWAILEQIKKPSACFKEIIQEHFSLKRDKILAQCATWLNETKELSSQRKALKHHYEALKAYFKELQVELGKLKKKNVKQEETNIQPANEANIDDVTPGSSTSPLDDVTPGSSTSPLDDVTPGS